MTAPARLEEAKASLAIATKEEIGLERVETLGKETASGQVTEKVVFPANNPQSVVPSSQGYVTTPSYVTSVVDRQQSAKSNN